MKIDVATGTPREVAVKTYDKPHDAKKWAKKCVGEWREFAARYNHRADAELGEVQRGIGDINFAILDVGAERSWSVTDEVSGLTWTVSLTKIER